MILILVLLFGSSAFAGETSLGVGKQTNGDGTNFQMNYRDQVWDGNYIQFKGGYFGGIHVGMGGGLRVDLQPFELRGGLSVGPTIGQSFLELNPEAYLGVKDRGGNAIGFQFDHFTSQGGRQYLTLQLTQRF